jgi:hypothetical protein
LPCMPKPSAPKCQYRHTRYMDLSSISTQMCQSAELACWRRQTMVVERRDRACCMLSWALKGRQQHASDSNTCPRAERSSCYMHAYVRQEVSMGLDISYLVLSDGLCIALIILEIEHFHNARSTKHQSKATHCVSSLTWCCTNKSYLLRLMTMILSGLTALTAMLTLCTIRNAASKQGLAKRPQHQA